MADEEKLAMVTILTAGYRARCVVSACGNVARSIVRYNDAGGRPISQHEMCIAHTREAKDRAVADGFQIYDDRTA
jgi:hypothetical protein